jgi:hypothetical protein
VFAVQGATIEKYKNEWLATVDKYYSEILPAQNEIEMEAVNGDA